MAAELKHTEKPGDSEEGREQLAAEIVRRKSHEHDGPGRDTKGSVAGD